MIAIEYTLRRANIDSPYFSIIPLWVGNDMEQAFKVWVSLKRRVQLPGTMTMMSPESVMSTNPYLAYAKFTES